MHNILVFLGPSLAVETGKNILSADYRPPAAHGDIMSAVVNDRPDAIVLIDGITLSGNAVWPKELLFALEKGVRLFGAAAHGALRAVEIQGMTGVGSVFEQFASGALEADDEIECRWRCQHHNYFRESLSLVNIRATLSGAVQDGHMTAEDAQMLLAAASRMYFPDRTIQNLVDAASRKSTVFAAATRQVFQHHYRDIQARDTELMLDGLASGRLLADAGKPIPEPAPKGLFFRMLYDNDRKVRHEDVALPLYLLRNEVALSHPDAEDIFYSARLRRLGVEYAGRLGLKPDEKAMRSEAERFRQKRYLQDDVVFQAWLIENDLTEEDFWELMTQLAAIRYMITGKGDVTREVLNELRLRGEYPQWKSQAAETEKAQLSCRDVAMELFNQSGLRALFNSYLQTRPFPWNMDIQQMAMESGLQSNALAWELAKRIAIDKDSGSPTIEDLFRLIGDF